MTNEYTNKLVNKVINKVDAKFGSVKKTCKFELLGDYDPINETTLVIATKTVDNCVRDEYSELSLNNDNVQRGDYKMLVPSAGLDGFDPGADNVKLTINGKSTTIAHAELDAADAVYTIHVKAS